MHVEVNYLLKILCPLHLLCVLASSRCLCVLISMLQDNSKRKLYIMPGYSELAPSMCSSLEFAYRFLHCLVGICDHVCDRTLRETELHSSACSLWKASEYCTRTSGNSYSNGVDASSEHVQFPLSDSLRLVFIYCRQRSRNILCQCLIHYRMGLAVILCWTHSLVWDIICLIHKRRFGSWLYSPLNMSTF
jgi:hypothetical protein